MKEKEEDEERNENICPQTDNQAENSKTEAHSNPLWSVDRRGAGQLREKRRMRREIRIFAHKHTIKQRILNSKTEAHSNPLWIVGGAGQLITEETVG